MQTKSKKETMVKTGIDFTKWIMEDGTAVHVKSFKEFPDPVLCRITNFCQKGILFKEDKDLAKAWINTLKAEARRRMRVQQRAKSNKQKAAC